MVQYACRRILFTVSIVVSFASALVAARTSAQTLRGRLRDGATGQPIDRAAIIMLTESGDSVASAITDEQGYFSVTSKEPGSFRLLASTLGYRAILAGTFDLGVGGEMTLELRMAPSPLRIDSILVSLDRPAREHFLVRNGFVRRYQLGLGFFVTPRAVEQSPATTTEGLFTKIPGLTVRPSGGFQSHRGDVIVMRGPTGRPCRPSLFVDGHKMDYDPGGGLSLSAIVPLTTVAAAEVYRSPAEVPEEYNVTRGGNQELCGVLVFWTKEGR